ncbi:MAG: translation elongation factor Ts [Thermoguttaceae bacterium]|nr:translation elongation factor Ts [Thermoguttaceae bacterium]
MAEITAKMVMELRSKTGLPMMDCKKALAAANGDIDVAIEQLRVSGKAKMTARSSERSTEFGRIAIAIENGVGAMIELKCESAPVAANDEFVQLVNDMAKALLATRVTTADELLALPSASKGGTLREQFDELTNRIREVFRVGRILRVEAPCVGYIHHSNDIGVLLVCEGDICDATGKDVCMQIAAMRPTVVAPENLDSTVVENERRIQIETLRNDPANASKPENILFKIVDGRMKSFFAEQCLLDQPFVKDSGKTVGEFVKEAAPTMKVVAFHHWQIGK